MFLRVVGIWFLSVCFGYSQTTFKFSNDPNSLAYQAAQAGIVPLYNLDGTPIVNARCAQGIVQSGTNGQWTANYSAMGFTNVTSFRAQAANPTVNSVVGSSYDTSINPPSTTSVSGVVKMDVSVVVAGVSVTLVSLATSAVPVSVSICGN